MDTATQAQLALLKRLLDQGRLTEAEYQAEVAALDNSGATFDQRGQTVQSQTNVGRDSIDLNGDANVVGSHNLVQLYKVYQTAPGKQRLTEAEFGEVLADYLGWVRREYGRTRLHGLQNLQQTGALDKPLTTIYTSLQVEHRPAVEPGGDLRQRRGQHQTQPEAEPRELPPLDMADLLTLGERIAIIGKAGSGKTTYLAFVASTLAGALLGQPLDVRLKPPQPDDVLPVPLLAPLRFWQVYREQCQQVNRYEKPEVGTLGAFLLWFLKARYKDFDTAEDFFERLLRGGQGALILLDGLDEVVQVTERRVVRDEVERLLTSQYPGNRCLVTAREAGYRDAPFGGDFILCRVQPLNQEQIAALVGAWCAQIYAQPHDGASACEDLVSVIARLNAERERRKQPPLIDTPLLVTMVVSVKYSRYELPRERAKLYDACVDVILSSEYTGREDDAGARQGVVNAGGPPDKQRGWLTYLAFQMHQGGEAGASLDEGGVQRILTPVFEQRGETAMLEPFLAAAGHRGGLFEERGGRYQFTHLTFQEYLAAQFLSRQWNRQPHGFLAQIVTEEWWREAVLLTIGSLDDPAPFEQRAEFIGVLCQLQGDMSARLAAAELAATGLNELPAPEPALLQLAQQRLAELWQAPDFSSALPKVRLAAGNALAVLGDDRDFDALVEIPAGPFLMGDDHDDRAKPRHEITLDAFRIGKYPVTVAQFRHFVEASGYQPRDPKCLRGIANHPVVYVTWHDARAYCAWLTQEWRRVGKIAANEEVRLPTEAEWEKAASWEPGGKGRKREFPWGDEWDATKCNTSESGLGTTSPVGMYPEGASAYGCIDLVGNVWEWTNSLWGKDLMEPEFKYPYDPRDERENLEAGGDIPQVLRGSSFLFDRNYTRCAYRYGNDPDLRHGNYGFRVCIVPRQE
jgi:formylglycine-generating enzyme required for sulfatase activity